MPIGPLSVAPGNDQTSPAVVLFLDRSRADWIVHAREKIEPIGKITAVGPIKELVRKVDTREIGAAMSVWLANPPQDLRAELQAWAAQREIDVE